MARWSKIGAPEAGFHERVYFAKLATGSDGKSATCIRSADGNAGFGLAYDVSTLPYFTFWRNTAALSDGYVIGLEPATNLPNTRSVEAAAGRVVPLGPHESVVFRLELHPLTTRKHVNDFIARIANEAG